ncbi:hypothetical protein C8N32_103107 [Rhodovulum imhoffii]|uniref:Uncharacterized protein n=1 Tax=Rhodovulum imhoffii TaxID=365340 RepID=A0A2T5BUR5_9RHOB|nr:hypothetical protein C8N32_103107 [Rhodovulum imhoffii]
MAGLRPALSETEGAFGLNFLPEMGNETDFTGISSGDPGLGTLTDPNAGEIRQT